jgi:hypothetical protein
LSSTTSASSLATPGRVPITFATALNGGELELAGSCFLHYGCLIAPGATAVHGREAICGMLAQMVDVGSRIEIDQSPILCAGDVAHGQSWSLSSAATGGGGYVKALATTTVLRRLDSKDRKLAIFML